MNRALHRPAAAPSALRLLKHGLFLLAAAGLGVAAGGLLAAMGARAIAAGLDLGQLKDRGVFTVAMGLAGALGGGGLGLWLGLRRVSAPWALARVLPGALAGLGASAVAVLAFAYVMTTPPPPAYPYLVTEIRLGAGDAPSVGLGAASGRTLWSAVTRTTRGHPGGRAVIEAVFPMAVRSGVDHVVVHRDQREVARFSLGLPSDPPATASFSPWLSPDRWQGTEAREVPSGVEMRFRIERRIVR
ncbi:MAG: hypothetical protein FD152_3550 [Xanthobacteraceae bacterium]|nr:MAG: hypothetical protein FD152_3550 [Xanthobacteraceae bacterium]